MTRGVIAAGASALLLWAASPAVGAGWIAWIALVPAAFVVLRSPGTRESRLAVPLTYALYLELLLVPALPFGLADGQWGDPAVPLLVDGSPVLVVALLAIPALGALLYAVRFGQPWLAERLGPGGRRVASVAVPALAWAALDFARVKLDPGGFWGPLFLSQADAAAGDLGALLGPWLITAAIVAVNYGLALSLLGRRATDALIPVAAVLGLTLLGSGAAAGGGRGDGTESVVVAAIQPGYDTAEEDREVLRHWEPGSYDLAALDLIEDIGSLTARAVEHGAEVVVWPEASLFIDPRAEPATAAALRRVAAASDSVLVVPYFVETESRSAVLAAIPRRDDDRRASAALTASRPKQRPMWFLGEEGGGEPDPRPLSTTAGAVGTLLGVDGQDPGIAAALADADAGLLAASTHDWSALATQQRAFAQLTARSVGAPVVRADWRYGSAIYGRDGAALASAGEDLRRTVVIAAVAPAAPTPYARIGDLAGWAVLALSAALAAAALVPARPGRREARPA